LVFDVYAKSCRANLGLFIVGRLSPIFREGESEIYRFSEKFIFLKLN